MVSALSDVISEVQVTVLEAGTRVGGRACTVEGKEMGGTYFHGIYGHPLYEYAVSEGIVGLPFTRGMIFKAG